MLPIPKPPFPGLMFKIALLSIAIALLPLACIARYRNVPSKLPRIHIIQDMDNQDRYKTQQSNDVFADGRASRAPIPGTVAYSPNPVKREMAIGADDHRYRGVIEAGYADSFPMELTSSVMERGKRQYDIYCSVCHGLSGYGNGIVNNRAMALQQGTWVQPASLHEDPYNARELGHYFNTITNGIRNMPAYGRQISVDDRWSIVAYLKALQVSQASPSSVAQAQAQSAPNSNEQSLQR